MIKSLSLHPKQLFFLLIFLGLFHLLTPFITRADNNPTLTNIKLANTRDDLLVYFDVRNAFSDKIAQTVQNGIPTTFSYYASLYKTSDSWLDKEISDIGITSTVKFNSLKQEYTVFRPWKDEKPSVTKSFDEAKEWMTGIDNLKVIPLEQLVKGGKYQIRLKVKLDRVTLPLLLHYVFFFVSFWDIETDWYVINFTY